MNMRNTFAETMPDTIGEKHNGGATSDSYVIDTGYECEEGVETACPSGQYRLTDDGDCGAIPEGTACPSGQYRLTDDGNCEAIPEDTACASGQYRPTNDGECEPIPEDTACQSGQYRSTDDGECEPIPDDTACASGQYRSTDDAECEPVPEHSSSGDKATNDLVLIVVAIAVLIVVLGACLCRFAAQSWIEKRIAQGVQKEREQAQSPLELVQRTVRKGDTGDANFV